MVPVSLCITAPAGSYLGMLLGQLMFMLGNSGGIVSLLTLMGLAAGWEFLKIAGVSNVVLSLAYAQFMLSLIHISFVCIRAKRPNRSQLLPTSSHSPQGCNPKGTTWAI